MGPATVILDAGPATSDESVARGLFRASARVAVLDQFRVPYNVDPTLGHDGLEHLRPYHSGPTLLWRQDIGGGALAATLAGTDRVAPIPLFTAVLADDVIEPLLRERGGTWHRARRLLSGDGRHLGSIWRSEKGDVFLPFDPNDVVDGFLSERYLDTSGSRALRRLRRGLMLAYYYVRPLLPRSVQIYARRQVVRLQARSRFPRWPIEPCLHDFFDLMLAIIGGISGGPVPCIAPWPNGHSWALVLSHDVEQAGGVAAVREVVELEREHGVRSSWNFVPRRYEIDSTLLSDLNDQGLEIGVHGVDHDGRDLESWATWQRRLPAAYDFAARWDAVGFRSAALHRHHEWMRSLRFAYDSSWPDTDPFEPQNGGCCTWLPFFNGQVVELPLTLPQDHTLFVILGHQDETVWVKKAEFLRKRGGLAVIDTHPDYLVDRRIRSAYDRFLARFADDAAAWHALPREVSAWWRRRAASHLEYDGTQWQITGPVSGEGRVVLEEKTW